MSSLGTILAVDDAPESLMTLTHMLAAEGYDVRPADSGELALASIAAARPELILLDIRMPGMSGLEVCRKLKARSETRDISVMFISGITESNERVEGLKLGAVDFVSKPFQREELLARIRTHIELSRLRHGLEDIVAERTASLKQANERLLRELNERRRVENALRESEERFRSMADNAPVVIWTSGADTKIDFFNQYALTFTGRPLEELTGDRWKEAMHPDDLEQTYANYRPIIAASLEYRVEYRLRRADGQYRWMLETAIPRRMADKSFAGYIGIAIDITELKQNREQWLAAQKLESLGVLVSGVAHNFNNLMAGIIAEADLALSDLPPQSPVYGNVERINSIAMRAADVVSLLSAYAGSGLPADLMTVDIPDVVDQSVDLTKATVSRNISFSVTHHHKPATVWADMSRIRQIVLNLLTNACESLPQANGTVCVSTSTVQVNRQDAARNPWGLVPGHYVQLSVKDNGCGIPEDALGRIFDPFFTTKFLGRGLGLAAVQGIVRSLGGSVQVESTVGIGSTFQVMLPCPAAGLGYFSPSKQMVATHGLVEPPPSRAHPVPSKLPEARSG